MNHPADAPAPPAEDNDAGEGLVAAFDIPEDVADALDPDDNDVIEGSFA